MGVGAVEVGGVGGIVNIAFVEWVQCSSKGCRKWRRLGDEVSASSIGSRRWYCKQNFWDSNFNDCL